MNLKEALLARHSVRAFQATPVPRAELEEIFALALRVPSNCNVQPWRAYVVSGAKKDELKRALVEAASSGAPPNPDFEWDVRFQGEHRERQFGAANALYGAMGIERTDRPARQAALLRNWEFFGAPHAAFFTMEKYLKYVGAVDLGIYAQALVLLMTERGIASCLQGALGMYPGPVRAMLGLPEEVGILFGMSFGYPEGDAPANRSRTDRVNLAAAVRFVD